MESRNIIIAIDPDKDESGVCVLYKETAIIKPFKSKFANLIDYVKRLEDKDKIKIFVEGGWLNQKSNWHNERNVYVASKIGKCVGENHQTGRLLAECFEFDGFDVEIVAPMKKCWKGRDGKITQEELNSIIDKTKYKVIEKRMNQDARDSVLLALFHGRVI